MADIVNVSDSILRFNTKVRTATDTTPISDNIVKISAKSVTKSLTENLTSTDTVTEERRKERLSTGAVTIAETIQLYKNGILVEPVAEIPTPQNIIGTREHRVRAPRRPPRAIIIDEVVNVAIAPLKLLAFSDSNNKAIVGIRPRLVNNAALSQLAIEKPVTLSLAYCAIKTQSEPMRLKARLCLPLSSLHHTTAKLKLRPQLQSIHSLKAINPQRVDKLHKLVTIAMMIENL